MTTHRSRFVGREESAASTRDGHVGARLETRTRLVGTSAAIRNNLRVRIHAQKMYLFTFSAARLCNVKTS